MKKLKIFTCFILMFALFCSMNVVKAEIVDYQQIQDNWQYFMSANHTPGIYTGYRCIHYEEYPKWEGNPASFMKLNDGSERPVYCVEPYVAVSDRTEWYPGVVGYDDINTSILNTVKYGFTMEAWKNVELYAWYGYGYDGHWDDEWYVATQLLIWKTVDPDLEVYIANHKRDAVAGNFDYNYNANHFENKMNEIRALASSHYITPNFNITNPLVLNTPSTFNDSNNVFSQYEIIGTSNCTALKNGNQITITPTKVGDISVTLCKGNQNSKGPILYALSGAKDVILRGEIPVIANVEAKAKIEDENKKMRIKITENSVKYKENVSDMSGAKFKVYIDQMATIPYTDNNGEEAVIEVTDANGKAEFKEIPTGTYYIRELIFPKGVNPDKTIPGENVTYKDKIYKVSYSRENQVIETVDVELTSENEGEGMVTIVLNQENANNDKYTNIGTIKIQNVPLNICVKDIEDIDKIIAKEYENVVGDKEKSYFKYDETLSMKGLETEIEDKNSTIVNTYFKRKKYKIKFVVAKENSVNGEKNYQIAVKSPNNDDRIWIDINTPIKFKVNSKEYYNEYELTAKYGEYIEWLYPYVIKEDNNVEYELMGWEVDESSKYFNTYERSNMVDKYKMMDENLILDPNDTEKEHILYANWVEKPIYYKYHYMCENLDQTETSGEKVKMYNGKYYTENRTADAIGNKITVYVNAHDDMMGYKKVHSEIYIRPGNVEQGTKEDDPIDMYIYYDRLEYELVINNMAERYIPSTINEEYNKKGIYLKDENGEKKIIVKYATKLSAIKELENEWEKDEENPFKYPYETDDKPKFAYMESWYLSPEITEKNDLDNLVYTNYCNKINIYANWILENEQ